MDEPKIIIPRGTKYVALGLLQYVNSWDKEFKIVDIAGCQILKLSLSETNDLFAKDPVSFEKHALMTNLEVEGTKGCATYRDRGTLSIVDAYPVNQIHFNINTLETVDIAQINEISPLYLIAVLPDDWEQKKRLTFTINNKQNSKSAHKVLFTLLPENEENLSKLNDDATYFNYGESSKWHRLTYLGVFYGIKKDKLEKIFSDSFINKLKPGQLFYKGAHDPLKQSTPSKLEDLNNTPSSKEILADPQKNK